MIPVFCRYVFPALLALAAVTGPASAQKAWKLHDALGAPDSLKLTVNARLRYEALDGQFRPGANPTDDLTSVRTIIFAEQQSGPFRFGAEFYDARAYGGRVGGAIGTGEVNTFEFIQAYVAADIKEPLGAGTSASLLAGRFQTNLGSRRYVAADDYRNTPNGYTGLRGDLKIADGTALALMYSFPQARLPDDLPSILDNKVAFDRESPALVLWGGTLTKPLPDKMLADATYLVLDEKDVPGRPTRDRHIRTVAGRIIRNPAPGTFDYEVEVAYQYGSISSSLLATAGRLPVAASLLHLDVGYLFTDAWNTRLSVDYDYVSGDDSKNSYGRFDTLFGSRRAEFAPSGIYAAIGRANINSPGLRWEVAPGGRWDAFASFRGLWLGAREDSFSNTGIRDASGRSGFQAGQQIEGRLRYWLVPELLRAEFNGAILFKQGVLRNAPNAPRTGDTHYISTALIATF